MRPSDDDHHFAGATCDAGVHMMLLGTHHVHKAWLVYVASANVVQDKKISAACAMSLDAYGSQGISIRGRW